MSGAHPEFDDIPERCRRCRGPVEPAERMNWYYCPNCDREFAVGRWEL